MATTVTCRKCAQALDALASSTPVPPLCPACRELADEFGRQVLGAFQGELTPRPPSLLYRMGIVLVAIMMVLLPLVYVGLTVGVAYLVFLHATVWGPSLLSESQRGGGRKQGAALILLYLGPLVAGSVLVLFMLKPLLAKKPARPNSRKLEPDAEPLLFEFIALLCRKVGAPFPRQIEVDCEVNASASFRRGWISLLSNDLVLTIGAPLVAGLSLRQFTGVLAHEFGHFAQGAGMRLTYVIRSVNAWFARVVYERDAWDEQLDAWSKNLPLRELQIVIWFTVFLVWLTRRILWALMMVGHAISCFMLRQMEFDADRFEAWLAGSTVFADAMRRVELLSVAWRGVIVDLQGSFFEGRLADNTCELLLINVEQLTPEFVQQIDAARDESKTSWSDTHPASNDRIASAMRENAPGIFQLEGRAADLFHDFPRLAREVTEDYYREVLGDRFLRSGLVPVAEILGRQRADSEGREAFARYYGAAFGGLRPLDLSNAAPNVPADLATAAVEIGKLRQAMIQGADEYQRVLTEYDAADTHWVEAEQALALIGGGLKVEPADFHLVRSDANAAQAAAESALETQRRLAPQLAQFEMLVERRLNLALNLLSSAELAGKLPLAAEWQTEVPALRSSARVLASAWPNVLRIRNLYACLGLMFHNLKGREEQQEYVSAIRAEISGGALLVRDLHASLQDVIYPFEHAVAGATVAHYALETLPAPDDLGAVYSSLSTVQEQLYLLVKRVASRLAVIAEAVEKAVDPVAAAEESAKGDPPALASA